MAYTRPTPADLKLRYSAFAAVADDRVQYWLTDAERGVDESWFAADYAPALMALAAHNMARDGLGAGSTGAPMGATSIRTGSFSATISEKAVESQIVGGFASTRYGQEYAAMLRRNKGGPRVTAPGAVVCCDGYNGFAGPLPPWQC